MSDRSPASSVLGRSSGGGGFAPPTALAADRRTSKGATNSALNTSQGSNPFARNSNSNPSVNPSTTPTRQNIGKLNLGSLPSAESSPPLSGPVPSSSMTFAGPLSSRTNNFMYSGGSQQLQQQQQQKDHVVDDDIALIDAVFSRVFNNLAIFKSKVMHNCNIPLSEIEQLTVLEGKEMDDKRNLSFKDALRQVQDTMLAKKKANIGFSQLTNIGNLFGGGVGASFGFGGKFTSRSAASGGQPSDRLNASSQLELEDTLSVTESAAIMSSVSGAFNNTMSGEVGQLTDEQAAIKERKKKSAHSRRVSTMQQQIKEQSQLVTDLIKEHIDGMFRFTLEDLLLRQEIQINYDATRLAPRKILDAAVGEQREQLDANLEQIRKLVETNKDLNNKVCEMQLSTKTRDEIHKVRLNGFLHEVCILKEQLYRSYRDKTYVGKPVDLMTTIEDSDTGEDVSVDQLLEYRKQMKGAERQISEANAKVRKFQEELKDKEDQMARVLDRARAKEASVNSMRKEMEQLNELAIEQREELRILRAENARMKGETAVDTAEVGSQATHDFDDAAQTKYTNVAISKIARNAFLSKLQIMEKFDEQTTKFNEVTEKSDTLTSQLLTLRTALLAEFKEKIDIAEREKDNAVRIKNETLSKAANAMRIAAEAEEMVEVVKYRAAEEIIGLTEELRTAQNSVHVLRLKSVAICRAHLSLATRYQVMKTKNGLDDYKKKANAFHYARAEVAVRTAQATVAEVRKQCATELENAADRITVIEDQAANAGHALEEQANAHHEEMRRVQVRVTAIENASRLLLQDYEHLRDEHFKAQAADAQRDAGGRPGSSSMGRPGRPGSGGDGRVVGSRVGSAGGTRLGSATRQKSAAPLPPPLLPTAMSTANEATITNNNDGTNSSPRQGDLSNPLSPVASMITSPKQLFVSAPIKSRDRLALHEALEKALDLAEEAKSDAKLKAASTLAALQQQANKNKQSDAGNVLSDYEALLNAQDGGERKSPTSTADIATPENQFGITEAELKRLAFDASKLRLYVFGSAPGNTVSGESRQYSGLVDESHITNTSTPRTTASDHQTFRNPAALPPLPAPVLLASSTLQLERQLGDLATNILIYLSKDSTPASAMHLMKGSNATAAAIGNLGYTTGNNLAAHVIQWAKKTKSSEDSNQKEAATSTITASSGVGADNNSFPQNKLSSKTPSAMGFNNNSSLGADPMASLSHTGSSTDISAAAALAGLAAGSWSRLRTLMPAYHAVRAATSKIAVIGRECPALQLPDFVPVATATMNVPSEVVAMTALPAPSGANPTPSGPAVASAMRKSSTLAAKKLSFTGTGVNGAPPSELPSRRQTTVSGANHAGGAQPPQNTKANPFILSSAPSMAKK